MKRFLFNILCCVDKKFIRESLMFLEYSHTFYLRKHRNESKGGRQMLPNDIDEEALLLILILKDIFLRDICEEEIYIEHKNRTSAIFRLDFFPQLTLKRSTAILQKNIFINFKCYL